MAIATVVGFGAEDPSAAAIKPVVRQAIADVRDAGTYKTTWTAGRLPDAARAAIHGRLEAALTESMRGEALAHWRTLLDNAIDRDSDGEHVIVTAGGVDTIEFVSIDVDLDGESATAVGRAHTWVTWVIIKPDYVGDRAGRPAGWDAFDATLQKIDGGWYVTSLELASEHG